MQNCLQLNDGNAQFQEISNMSGVSATDWSWGALILDFDNDGWKDIYVCNAIYHEIMHRILPILSTIKKR
ncbi:MAG: VCBS repeat-containing protein [Haliscomenobacter sp.]|nr:VCBS repeat-containing protein [Haliscomenobacter sp.]